MGEERRGKRKEGQWVEKKAGVSPKEMESSVLVKVLLLLLCGSSRQSRCRL